MTSSTMFCNSRSMRAIGRLAALIGVPSPRDDSPAAEHRWTELAVAFGGIVGWPLPARFESAASCQHPEPLTTATRMPRPSPPGVVTGFRR